MSTLLDRAPFLIELGDLGSLWCYMALSVTRMGWKLFHGDYATLLRASWLVFGSRGSQCSAIQKSECEGRQTRCYCGVWFVRTMSEAIGAEEGLGKNFLLCAGSGLKSHFSPTDSPLVATDSILLKMLSEEGQEIN